MPLVVKSQIAMRVERRLDDYCWVLDQGTHESVGRSGVRPDDRRPSLGPLPASTEAEFQALDRSLDQIWKADEGHWQRRLQPFMSRLGDEASRRFAGFVKHGCQPDMLAKYFTDAASVKTAARDTRYLRREIGYMLKLKDAALKAVRALSNRRTAFDDYTSKRGYRVLEGVPGPPELTTLLSALEEFAEHDSAELNHYLRQLDGRRQLLLTDPVMKLSGRIRTITGKFHDVGVELILARLRAPMDDGSRNQGPLKRRRARWNARLRGRTKPKA